MLVVGRVALGWALPLLSGAPRLNRLRAPGLAPLLERADEGGPVLAWPTCGDPSEVGGQSPGVADERHALRPPSVSPVAQLCRMGQRQHGPARPSSAAHLHPGEQPDHPQQCELLLGEAIRLRLTFVGAAGHGECRPVAALEDLLDERDVVTIRDAMGLLLHGEQAAQPAGECREVASVVDQPAGRIRRREVGVEVGVGKDHGVPPAHAGQRRPRPPRVALDVAARRVCGLENLVHRVDPDDVAGAALQPARAVMAERASLDLDAHDAEAGHEDQHVELVVLATVGEPLVATSTSSGPSCVRSISHTSRSEVVANFGCSGTEINTGSACLRLGRLERRHQQALDERPEPLLRAHLH